MSKTAIKGEVITKDNIAKIRSYSDDEIAVMPADEKQACCVALKKRQETISFILEDLKASSGINDLESEDKDIDSVLSRFSLSLADINQMEDNSQSLVNIHQDDVVSVNDGESSRYETQDTITDSYVVSKETTYVLCDDVNYLFFLNEMNELGLRDCLKLGKQKLSSLEDDEFNYLARMLDDYNLLDAIVVVNSVFSKAMSQHHDKRDQLLAGHYIRSTSTVTIKKATNKQLSLFDEDENEEVPIDIIPIDIEDEDIGDILI